MLCPTLTLCTRLTPSCPLDTTWCPSGPTVLTPPLVGTRTYMCVHIQSLQRNIPILLCTNHFMIRGGGKPYLLLTLMCLPTVLCPQDEFIPTNVPLQALRTPYPAPPPIRWLPLLLSAGRGAGAQPTHYLGRLWTPSSDAGGSTEQGKGGAGPARMQRWGGGGQGGCPRGGWSAAASAPAREAGRHNPSWIWFPARVTARSRPGRLHLSN